MLSAFKNILKVEDLRKKVFYTLAIVALVRLVQNIPVPGIDLEQLGLAMEKIKSQSGTGGFVSLINIFSGGALTKFAIGVLGIMPYITASIVLQLMSPVVPQLEKMKKEGAQGQQKYIQLTRYITIVICLFQGFGLAKGMPMMFPEFNIVVDPSMSFYLITTIILTASAMLIMWLGEQITDKGLGQGASIVITVSVISSMPQAIMEVWSLIQSNDLTIIHGILIAAIFLAVTAATVMVVQGMRKIPLKYAKRTAGSRGAMEKTSFLPLKVNHAGVMPIIFAGPVMMFPALLGQKLGWTTFAAYLSYGTWTYVFVYAILVIGFTFFWVATQFNPIQIADDLNRQGGFIPGIRPGDPTKEFLNDTMTKITYAGAIFLTLLAISPMVLFSGFEKIGSNHLITSFFGGTSLLIMVGVILQIMQQIEVQLVQHNYDGFVSSGRLRSRQG